MGSLVPTTGNGLSIYEAPDNPWAEAAAAVETGAYLKFNGNTGEFTYGADDVALAYGSQLVGDLFNVAFGWICWKDSEPVEEVLVKILDGKPPLEHNLTDHGPYDSDDDGWREATSLPMVLLCNGEDDDSEAGTRLLFKGSSGSTVRGVRKLSGAFGKLFREHQGELPVIEISAESFQAREKKYGKKWAPIFKIVGWIGEDELTALVGEVGDTDGDYEPEEEEAPAPAKATRRRAAPAPEPEPEEEEEEEEPARPARRAPAQAPRTRRSAPAPEPEAEEAVEEEEELPAPTPRGRSPERKATPAAAAPAAPAGGRRVRRF